MTWYQMDDPRHQGNGATKAVSLVQFQFGNRLGIARDILVVLNKTVINEMEYSTMNSDRHLRLITVYNCVLRHQGAWLLDQYRPHHGALGPILHPGNCTSTASPEASKHPPPPPSWRGAQRVGEIRRSCQKPKI